MATVVCVAFFLGKQLFSQLIFHTKHILHKRTLRGAGSAGRCENRLAEASASVLCTCDSLCFTVFSRVTTNVERRRRQRTRRERASDSSGDRRLYLCSFFVTFFHDLVAYSFVDQTNVEGRRHRRRKSRRSRLALRLLQQHLLRAPRFEFVFPPKVNSFEKRAVCDRILSFLEAHHERLLSLKARAPRVVAQAARALHERVEHLDVGDAQQQRHLCDGTTDMLLDEFSAFFLFTRCEIF